MATLVYHASVCLELLLANASCCYWLTVDGCYAAASYCWLPIAAAAGCYWLLLLKLLQRPSIIHQQRRQLQADMIEHCELRPACNCHTRLTNQELPLKREYIGLALGIGLGPIRIFFTKLRGAYQQFHRLYVTTMGVRASHLPATVKTLHSSFPWCILVLVSEFSFVGDGWLKVQRRELGNFSESPRPQTGGRTIRMPIPMHDEPKANVFSRKSPMRKYA